MNKLAALDRTLRLIHLDLLPDAPQGAVLAALEGTRVRLRASPANVASPAGQTAVVTTLLLLNELGFSVSLDLPDTQLAIRQPPLRGTRLRSAIEAASDDLLTPLSSGDHADIEVAFGDSPQTPRCRVIRVEATDWTCRVTAGESVPGRLTGAQPFGASFAAVAATAEVFRITMASFSERSRNALLPEHNTSVAGDVILQLPELVWLQLNLGRVDVISAGALSTALLYLLLRVPGLQARLRVVDDDEAAEDNLNRYLLLTRDFLGRRKVDVLASFQTRDLVIEPVAARLTEETVSQLRPLAERVVVGVDDIPSRWLAQKHAPNWVGVAGTTHFETIVSEHQPGSACAACLHPYVDEGPDEPIPTISFVSAFAGFMLAYRLARAAAQTPHLDATLAYPFNLGAERGVQTLQCAPHPKCPLRCSASMLLSHS